MRRGLTGIAETIAPPTVPRLISGQLPPDTVDLNRRVGGVVTTPTGVRSRLDRDLMIRTASAQWRDGGVQPMLDPVRGGVTAVSDQPSPLRDAPRDWANRRCICGHAAHDHHDTYWKKGAVLGSECEFYGSNEEGGMAWAHEDGSVCSSEYHAPAEGCRRIHRLVPHCHRFQEP